ncbi:ROK family protein [Fusibacter bizertensis]|uniref:ROK family protein n=1 Tax=Fusibacter bizertensis TaxID=1488331 RepID=A0ABT6N8R6_9FIRM|nr:ROK family protein [Fusibacter bizertensis]MDH8676821.1 ROK family protein [Fusibacter bizertensis]
MNYIAIDIGGSAIKAAIVNSEGMILEKTSTPTPMTNYDDLISELTTIVNWAMAISPIDGIAMSQPCVTDAKTGEALSEGALIYINGTNPSKDLGEKYNLPYSADNDGNCAALAEVWIGRAKDVNDIALVVCGSGIGGAVVLDKKIYSGNRRFAGEFGFIINGYESDGTPIIWSANGSTLSLVKNYASKTNKEVKSLNGKLVFELAESGDIKAQESIDHFFKMFAYGLHNIQHVYDPELILIGGAISNRPDFVKNIELEFDKLYEQLFGFMSRPNVAICACGADANLIGAVYHLINKYK